ncbi:TMEM175 family protein [Thermogemmatispora carboxidivorans]|uniref:TMEM175 family protein n=1 Tax=Thermogemmatispora carboxidivorans TaxID=1382306 RepID=UPI00069C5655|nr:TMEM175 family protein [Thermogemmatispora carboxidivorans]
MQQRHAASRDLLASKDRLSALSDGIFAVAMTLLVLDIRLPDGLGSAAVPDAFLDLLPRFLIYVMTFFLCSSYWYGQHRLMDRMTVVDGGFSALCLLFLFFITLLPVTMNSFGRYPGIPLAIAFYTLNLACCGLALVMLTWYAVFHRGLLERAMGRQVWEHALYYGLPTSLLLLSSLLLLLFTRTTLPVMVCWLLIPAVTGLTRLIGRKQHRQQS